MIDARTRHYGDFYGLTTPFDPADGDIALVVGNCQAESLRVMLDGGGLRTVRMPPVHELVASDLPFLGAWLTRATVLVSQPIRDDYHDLPLGDAQLSSRMSASARTVLFPVVRFAGLYPAHAIVRPPRDPSIVPPVVEYHDLRLLAEAAGRPLAGDAIGSHEVREVAEFSRAQLRRRESAHDTVVVSDVFDRPSFDLMRTLNHPGNAVWSTTAARVRERLGMRVHVVDPGRPLLDSIHAPREAAVIEAWGLDDEPTDVWLVRGEVVTADEVRREHLAWYAQNPDIVAAGIARHAATLAILSAS